MRNLAKAILACWLALSMPAAADDNLVVVELFTSQGCSSCPPADDIFAELAQRDDVLALALHVDYWDYIGWADEFASPAFTERQKTYARAHDKPSVYTPQMIVGGRDVLVGVKPMKLADLIQTHEGRAPGVTLSVTREGGLIRIEASNAVRRAPLVVDLVTYIPRRTVDISRGENAGRTLDYHNIVASWSRVGTWDGSGVFSATVTLGGKDPAAVIVQEAGPGAILAASRVR
ncbi:DUF1223 domain-containing protein [Palleronia sp. KMU-117]|uniref:DUF1223 domain-containing protein n=1 Tax=Palleronia sp. KMU-117 TaxID=3434108 RepID=UPI003D74EED6